MKVKREVLIGKVKEYIEKCQATFAEVRAQSDAYSGLSSQTSPVDLVAFATAMLADTALCVKNVEVMHQGGGLFSVRVETQIPEDEVPHEFRRDRTAQEFKNKLDFLTHKLDYATRQLKLLELSCDETVNIGGRNDEQYAQYL